MSRSCLGDFDIVSRLGAGSFGTVFKVRRKVDDQFYVIKNVRIAELGFKEQAEAINEVQILAQLKSPFVVRYFDSFIEEDSLHIVMEFCNRGDLQNLLKKAKEKNVAGLKENVVWNICLQVILGLQYLHRKHILHRDLKCANVFLMKDANNSGNYLVKIGDLGVAKLMDTSTALASTIVGTPYYLSPELCKDMPYRDKSDCWALGVLIYECCTLQRPFEARNQCALIMKIIESPVTLPPASSTSLELSNLILWLLQKDPKHRPSTRHILNENIIREKLAECNLTLPPEQLEDPITHYLSDRTKSFRVPFIVPPFEPSPRSTKEVNENLGIKVREAVTEGPEQSSEGDKKPIRQSSLRKETTKNIVKAEDVAASKVRGDRVRGANKRVPSERALLRYQTRQTSSISAPASNTVDAGETKAQAKEDREEIELIQKDEHGGKDSRDLSDDKPSINKLESSVKDLDLYEDDFETADDESQEIEDRSLRAATQKIDPFSSSSFRGSGSIQASAQSTSDVSYAVPGGEEDAELWNSVWTEKRGVIGLNAHLSSVSNAPKPAPFDERDEINDEGQQGNNELEAEPLSELIREAKSRAIAALGEPLFWSVYDLCRKHMGSNLSSSDQQDDEEEEDQAEFMQELEDILCEQNGIESACEAVFGVKVLLALESKYNYLVSFTNKPHK